MLLVILYSYYSMTATNSFVNEKIEILRFAQDDFDMTADRIDFLKKGDKYRIQENSRAAFQQYIFNVVIPDLIRNPVFIVWIPASAGMTE